MLTSSKAVSSTVAPAMRASSLRPLPQRRPPNSWTRFSPLLSYLQPKRSSKAEKALCVLGVKDCGPGSSTHSHRSSMKLLSPPRGQSTGSFVRTSRRPPALAKGKRYCTAGNKWPDLLRNTARRAHLRESSLSASCRYALLRSKLLPRSLAGLPTFSNSFMSSQPWPR